MAELTWGRYETLRPRQVDAIKQKTPVAYIPWGAIEWHSYHNPIGLDAIKAHALCEALARETGGVVLPAFFVGTDTIKPFKGFHHTLDYRDDVVRGLVAGTLEQLADEGFKTLVLITGHYGGGHVRAVKECAEAFRAAHPEVKVWAFPEYEVIQDVFPGNHAAHGETSFLLHFHPDYVDLAQLPQDRQTTLDKDGVMGDDPRTATPEAGRDMLRLFLERAVPRVREMMSP